MKVVFYTKPGCWFCDQAEEMLNGQRERYGIEVQTVDITRDDEAYELYRYDVPVMEFADGSHLHGHIKKKDFMAKLEGLKEA